MNNSHRPIHSNSRQRFLQLSDAFNLRAKHRRRNSASFSSLYYHMLKAERKRSRSLMAVEYACPFSCDILLTGIRQVCCATRY